MKKVLLLSTFLLFCISSSFTQFSWEHTDGPDGGFVPHFISNDDYIFTHNRGFLYRSDTGTDWKKMEFSPSYYTSIYKEKLVSLHQDFDAEEAFLSVSKDNGETWETEDADFLLGLNSIVVNEKEFYGFAPDYENYTTTLHYTINEGSEWKTKSYDPILPLSCKLKVFDNKIYLQSHSSIYVLDTSSLDVDEITPFESLGNYIRDFTAWENNIVIATQDRIYISDDSSDTWIYKNVPKSNINDNLTRLKDTIYAYSDKYFFKTTDMGESWDSIYMFGQSIFQLHGFKDQLFLSSYDKGILKLDYGAQSISLSNRGHGIGYVYDLERSNETIWAACGSGVFKYDIATNNWEDMTNFSPEDPSFINISVNENGWVLVQNDNNTGFYISKDEGLTWTNLSGSFSDFGYTSYQIFGDHIFRFNQGNIARTIYNNTFNFSNTGLQFSNQTFFQRITKFKDQLVFPSKEGISISNDDGESWITYTENLPDAFFSLYATDNYLFSVSPNYDTGLLDLFVSTNGIDWVLGGQIESDISSALQNFLEDTYFFEINNKFYVFWGQPYDLWSGTGIYSTNNPMESWTFIGDNNERQSPSIINNGILYAGKHGMWSGTIDQSLSIQNENAIKPYKLKIQPNPASKNILIEIEEPINDAELMVYDAVGQLVMRRQDIMIQKELNVDISTLQNGIYFIALRNTEKKYINRLVIKK